MNADYEFTERQLLCHILAHYKHQVNRYSDMFKGREVPQILQRQIAEHKAVVHLIESYIKELNYDLG